MITVKIKAKNLKEAHDILESEIEEGLQYEVDEAAPGETVYCFHYQMEVEKEE